LTCPGRCGRSTRTATGTAPTRRPGPVVQISTKRGGRLPGGIVHGAFILCRSWTGRDAEECEAHDDHHQEPRTREEQTAAPKRTYKVLPAKSIAYGPRNTMTPQPRQLPILRAIRARPRQNPKKCVSCRYMHGKVARPLDSRAFFAFVRCLAAVVAVLRGVQLPPLPWPPVAVAQFLEQVLGDGPQ
jgi:hypothetical protein